MPRLILQVAVPSPLFQTFDYLAPPGVTAELQPGIRVRVPFGRQRRIAVLIGTSDKSRIESSRLRAVDEILDREPVLSADLMELAKWASRYYQHPLGEVIGAMLPELLRKGQSPMQTAPECWWLTEAGKVADPSVLKRAPRQAQLLDLLAMHPEGATAAVLREEMDTASTVLRNLQDKGWVQCRSQWPSSSLDQPPEPGPELTDQQSAVLEALDPQAQGFSVHLLEGVTGSGKTEIYLRRMAPVLESGRQVLVLVPEIGLTPQLVQRFERRLGLRVARLHSGLNATERLSAWQMARSGAARIILGTRSAVFVPLKAPGLFIVDEEHDASLKQQEGFRYSARDLLVLRAQKAGVPVLMGSATPSLESVYNVDSGRYQHVRLAERPGKARAPDIQVLDVRRQPMEAGLSMTLSAAIDRHLRADGQVLLFLNRRGYAPVLLCHDCGWVAECRRCDARLILHRTAREMRCHHCGAIQPVIETCPTCHSQQLVNVGQGTERLEQLLAKRFPQQTLLRIDRDTTRRKGQLEAMLAKAQSGEASLLLGTQMLAKGHDFPGVTLVAVIDIDQGLFGVDFRASERMAQLIVQVAGRAGRADRAGEVIIQTHYPDHPLLQRLLAEGYDAFARSALEERREAGFPPCSAMAILRAEATDKDHPQAFLESARVLSETLPCDGVELWGPVAAPMERLRGRYRAQLFVQARQRKALHRLLDPWVRSLDQLPLARKVRWSIDVDPVEMY